MANVEVDGDVWRGALFGLGKVLWSGEFVGNNARVVVHADAYSRLLRMRIDALGGLHIGTGSEAFDAERFGKLEATLDLVLVEIVAEAVIVCVKHNARFLELFAHCL